MDPMLQNQFVSSRTIIVPLRKKVVPWTLTLNPSQWILANTCGVPAEDSYHWLDISTTICDFGKDLTTHNTLHPSLVPEIEAWPVGVANSDNPIYLCLQFLDRYRGKRVPV